MNIIPRIRKKPAGFLELKILGDDFSGEVVLLVVALERLGEISVVVLQIVVNAPTTVQLVMVVTTPILAI